MLTRNPDRPVPHAALATDDPALVLDFALDALGAGMPTALVTLVAVTGGSSRAPGAQMAVRTDGHYCGVVSGGCVEAAAAAEAMAALAEGRGRRVRFGAGSPFFDIALPCGGGITLDIHLLADAAPLLSVRRALLARGRAALLFGAGGEGLSPVDPAGGTARFGAGLRVVYRPEVRLVVSGAGLEAETLCMLALASGYTVSPAAGERLAIDRDTAVVLLHHDIERDLPVLSRALSAAPFYLGALGSRRTHQRRVARLSAMGFTPSEIDRIKAPVGLFPRARDARTLALSILADIAAVRNG